MSRSTYTVYMAVLVRLSAIQALSSRGALTLFRPPSTHCEPLSTSVAPSAHGTPTAAPPTVIVPLKPASHMQPDSTFVPVESSAGQLWNAKGFLSGMRA